MKSLRKGTPVIHYLEGQSKDVSKGGSMRLGAYDCEIKAETLTAKIMKLVESQSDIVTALK